MTSNSGGFSPAAVLDENDFVKWRSSSYEAQWRLAVAAESNKTTGLYQIGSFVRVTTAATTMTAPTPTGKELRGDWIAGALVFYERAWTTLTFEAGDGDGSPCDEDDNAEALSSSSWLRDGKSSTSPSVLRDLWTVPRIPFLTSTGRHFTVAGLRVSIPNMNEPIACSVAFYDRELAQKLTPDVFVSIPNESAGHVAGDARKVVFTLAHASRDILLVVRLYKLWRPTGGDNYISSEMNPKEKKEYDAATDAISNDPVRSTLFEPFAVAYCPTLRPRAAEPLVPRVKSAQEGMHMRASAPPSLSVAGASSLSDAALLRTKSSLEALHGRVELPELFVTPRTTMESFFELITRSREGAPPINSMFLLPGTLSLDVEPDVKNIDANATVLRVPPFASSLSVHSSAFNDLYITVTRLSLSAKHSIGVDAGLLVQTLYKPNAKADPQVLACGGGSGSSNKGKDPQQSSVARLKLGTICEWFDEIHVALPLMMQADAQLVLVVSQASESGGVTPVYTIMVPLFQEGHDALFPDGSYAVKLPGASGAFVCQLVSPDTVLAGEPALFFRSRSICSIYQPEPALVVLKPCFPGTPLASKKLGIVCVQSIPRPVERANFPLIVTLLLETAAEFPDTEEGSLAFCEALSILDRLHMSFPDSSLTHHPCLTSYVLRMYTPRADIKGVISSNLVSVWLRVIEEKAGVASWLEKMTLSRSWVLFDLIMKCALLGCASSSSSLSLPLLAGSSSSLRSTSASPRGTITPVSGAGSPRNALPGRKHSVSVSPMSSPRNSSGEALPLLGRPSAPPPAAPLLPETGTTSAPGPAPATAATNAPLHSPQPVATPSGTPPTGLAPPLDELVARKSKKIVVKISRGSISGSSGSLPMISGPSLPRGFLTLLGKVMDITAHFEVPDSAETSFADMAKWVRIAFHMHRGSAMDLMEYIVTYIASTPKTLEFLPSFFGTLFRAMPEYVSLNLPRAIPFTSPSEEYCEMSFRAHPLCGLLIKRVALEVASSSGSPSAVLTGCLDVLVHLLASHDEDSRLLRQQQQQEGDVSIPLKALVVEMYFPLVVKLVDSYEATLALLEGTAGGLLFSCMIYVVSNVSPELRRAYWQSEASVRVERLLSLLTSGLRRLPDVGGKMAVEASYRAGLNLLEDLISTPKTDTFDPRSFASQLFHLIGVLLSHAPLMGDSMVVPLLIDLSKRAAQLCLDVLFALGTSHCRTLVLPVMLLCNSESDTIASLASGFLFWLIELEEKHTRSFKQMHLACTIAVSRFAAAENTTGDMHRLKMALDQVIISAVGNVSLHERIAEMIRSLIGALHSSAELRVFESEPERKVEICQRISDGYASSPDLRLTWFKIISDLNRANGAPAEAAHACLIRAYLIAQYLDQKKELDCIGPFVLRELVSISPYLSWQGFVGITPDDVRHQGTALTLDCWSVDGLGTELFDAGNLFVEAGLETTALSCYNICILLRKMQSETMQLLRAYSAAQMCCKALVKTGSRPKPEEKFFRVRFVGKAFGKLCDKAFVYRGDPSHRLMDFSQFIVKRCEDNRTAYGALEVALLGNDKEVTPELLDQSKSLYVQVARVYPVEARADGVVSVFSLDMAHSETEKKQQQLVGMQGRKKLFFHCSVPFPFFNRRVPIAETKVVILSPLENAVMLMRNRVDAIREAVATKSATVISGILYGNVMTTISEGPEAVAEAFLASPGDDKENTAKLRGLMKSFLEVTLEALRVHQSIMAPDMKGWQQEAMERFAVLEKRVGPFCNKE